MFDIPLPEGRATLEVKLVSATPEGSYRVGLYAPNQYAERLTNGEGSVTFEKLSNGTHFVCSSRPPHPVPAPPSGCQSIEVGDAEEHYSATLEL